MSENPQDIPVFPGSIKTIHLADKDMIVQEGMTLRDYLASSAMNGICLNSKDTIELDDKSTAECIAKLAYEIADAMLKARESRPKT